MLRNEMKITRYLVLHEGVVAKFPWIVINADDGEPALCSSMRKSGACRWASPACSETLSLIALTLAAHLRIA